MEDVVAALELDRPKDDAVIDNDVVDITIIENAAEDRRAGE
jgi:hypothetical protein